MNNSIENYTKYGKILGKKRRDKMEKPIFIYQKNADKVLNRVVLPKKCIEKWGRAYYLEVYEDKIVLVPVKEK